MTKKIFSFLFGIIFIFSFFIGAKQASLLTISNIINNDKNNNSLKNIADINDQNLKIDLENFNKIELKDFTFIFNKELKTWLRINNISGEIIKIPLLNGIEYDDFFDYNQLDNSFHFMIDNHNWYYDIDSNTFNEGKNFGENRNFDARIRRDSGWVVQYILEVLINGTVVFSFPIADQFWNIGSNPYISSLTIINDETFEITYYTDSVRTIKYHSKTNRLDWSIDSNGDFEFYKDGDSGIMLARLERFEYQKIYTSFDELYIFHKGAFLYNNQLVFVDFKDFNGRDWSTQSIPNSEKTIAQIEESNSGNFYLKTTDNFLYYYSFSERDIFTLSQDFNKQILISNDNFLVTVDEQQNLEVNFSGIKFINFHANSFYENHWVFDNKDFQLSITNEAISSVSLNGELLTPIANSNHWLIDLRNEKYDSVNEFNLKLNFRSGNKVEYKFSIIEDYMPKIQVTQNYDNQNIKRYVYSEDSILIDGYKSNHEMNLILKDDLIASVTLNSSNIDISKQQLINTNGKNIIMIIDKFGKTWEYHIYFEQEYPTYWYETDLGQQNYQKSLSLGYSENQITNFNAYESSKISMIESEIFDLSIVNIMYNDFGGIIRQDIIDWYDGRIPYNRINYNHQEDKFGNQTENTFKQMVEESYLDELNRVYGNGNYYDEDLTSSDIEFVWSFDENKLMMNDDETLIIKGVDRGEQTRTINETWDLSILLGADLFIDFDEFNEEYIYNAPFTKILSTNIESFLSGLVFDSNYQALMFSDIQNNLNEIVIESFNEFVKTSDYGKFPYETEPFMGVEEQLKIDDIVIGWDVRNNDTLVKDIPSFSFKISANKQSFAVRDITIENIPNYLYDYFLLTPTPEINNISAKQILAIIFLILIILISIAFIIWIIIYKFKDKKYSKLPLEE